VVEAAPKPSLPGLWVGKLDGRPFYLTVSSVDGSTVRATAELQNPDGFVRLDLRGVWSEDTGRVEFVDPYEGGVFSAALTADGLAGSATVQPGEAPVRWATTRR
jgi:hypothetical protein